MEIKFLKYYSLVYLSGNVGEYGWLLHLGRYPRSNNGYGSFLDRWDWQAPYKSGRSIGCSLGPLLHFHVWHESEG